MLCFTWCLFTSTLSKQLYDLWRNEADDVLASIWVPETERAVYVLNLHAQSGGMIEILALVGGTVTGIINQNKL